MRRFPLPRPIDLDELRAVAEATLRAEPYVHPRDLEDVRARVQRRAWLAARDARLRGGGRAGAG